MIHNWENYFDTSSEYWKKVEKIYEENESFPKKVVKDRNLHHKFPRSFSKKDGVAVDNDEDNLVSLSLADHFRVHFYLWKCTKKGYRGMMAKAFVFMRKKMVVYATDETIEQIARDYETAMREAKKYVAIAVSEANKGKKLSEETKKKLSEANKGKKLPEETKRKMSEAAKGKHLTEKTKNKMSKAAKGRTFSEETRNKISDALKGKPTWNKGKHLSEETKKKLSEARKGMRWFNNGETNIKAKECPPGFVPGMVK